MVLLPLKEINGSVGLVYLITKRIPSALTRAIITYVSYGIQIFITKLR